VCGIAGKIVFGNGEGPVDESLLAAMAETLQHRGPDGSGVWTDGQAGLVSTRLAIIDLTDRGRMPMASEDGRLRIVFNGEIYNFQELRAELESCGHRFRSRTDTETILHLYQKLGPGCLDRLNGMFAFAIWDAAERTMFLARDRLGKKPLYYLRSSNAFLFASEPKAIMRDPHVSVESDAGAIHHVLTYGYVPPEGSAFKRLQKVPPAHYLLVEGSKVTVRRYWQLRYEPKHHMSTDSAIEELNPLLERAVARRLVADVPVGALLSGGMDSSAVVALMRRKVSGALKTFSVGFREADYNELPYAREVAQRFGTDHDELIVGPHHADMLPRLVWHYNEPYADSSALPTFVLCGLARQSVTVALNGDGGDESFLGYKRYLAMQLTSALDRVPNAIRTVAARTITALPFLGATTTGRRVQRMAGALALDRWDRYGRWTAYFDNDQKRALCTADFAAQTASTDSLDRLRATLEASTAHNAAEAAADADLQLYLPEDLLVKMDIASMAHSLELRSPLLDQEVVEFAARLPRRLKLRGLTSKFVLRRAMAHVLPKAVLHRPKMGFGVPIDRWLRHEWRDLAYDTLLSNRARGRGYFVPSEVRRYLDEHTSGRAQHQYRIWNLLMIELWHRAFVDQEAALARPA
jgi:asparagine synthase (glutamine-hydrolysing)